MAFFTNDAEFDDPDQWAEFAVAMVKKNCFLFSQNRGLDIKAWSGLWSAPFMLQTFAHHFNFTQGYIEVTALDTEQMSPRVALALSCAAFQSIVDDTLWTYVKKGKAIAMALIPTIVEDDAHEELFSYC
ncbi:hypothetical protein SCLCIDRAFT_28834 [Scleroderma citrinum Foug A]|uniref:Uncharacterized protein n=1 Tax=Scleroderma citrinum Foug A TaxID=1036808 RepID=A0A0C3D9T0_9AGAM|nr:hypothetical protein SCLCIDRAFT_28834 [Scleroderma citrinum Foug A]